MSANIFHFKQFSIRQENCAMKVGTDSVLLGAWATLAHTGNILDIGTGTGILAIMAAQRTRHTAITGIEIAPHAAQQARENCEASPWKERITIEQADFIEFARHTDTRYATILSNPPYFDDLLPPDAARSTARHAVALRYEDIFDLSRRLLQENGTLALIFPASLFRHIDEIAMLAGWSITRQLFVSTRPGKEPKRVLCEWQHALLPRPAASHLTIECQPGIYSQEYIALTQDFYLKFGPRT